MREPSHVKNDKLAVVNVVRTTLKVEEVTQRAWGKNGWCQIHDVIGSVYYI